MFEDFARITSETFKYAFRPSDLARCYRNLAFYYVERKDYKVAVCCLLFSIQFANYEMVNSELYYISQQMGEMYRPSNDELVSYFKENQIPYDADEAVLKIAYAYGMYFFESNDIESANYFLQIVGTYVDDKDLNQTLQTIASNLK
ncbi:MAG: hypothetical protein E7207_07700 [Clostridium butyricum]|nr:hypothetical protein [Clostridium butyricum]